ncbi:oligosaccharide flippase family protein [Amantichitinum ursilacus]|uniref:Putative O-antigen transporter n=1 Tax=Amantichitinum ursilacus TaxID=857265 RepID=A0A0N0GKT0_9NEIS|nr:oligosaccharide flippase family protein [Amantichitinum ursilacus]KPC49134.1 putative O-antigen transporter [Amantichitinum ursilacus]
MIDRRMASNIVALYAVKGMQYLMSFATYPFLTHTLQAQGFGAMNYAASVIQYGLLLTDFGFDLSATREIAVARGNDAAVARIFWRTTLAKTMLALISVVLLTLSVAVVPQWRVLAPVFAFSMLNIVASVVFPLWFFQGMEELRLASLLGVAGRALMLGFLFWLVRSPADVGIAVVLQAMPLIIAGAFWWTTQWGLPRPPWRKPTRPDVLASLRMSWPFFLSALSGTLYTSATTTLVGMYCGVQEVGYFSAANKLLYNIQGLIGLLVQATYPRISQLAQQNKPAAVALIRKAMYLQGGAGLVLTLILLIGAPWMMPLLTGHDLAASAPVMRWMSPIILLGALSYVFGMQSLLPFGHDRYFSRILMIAGAGNVLALLVLLPGAPTGEGAIRAAQVVLTVESFLVLAYWWRARTVWAEARAA